MNAFSELLGNFGVTWPKFIAQVILFGIVYWVLNRYAFGPIVDVLAERRRRIAEAQDNAEKIKQQLAEAEQRYNEVLAKADAEAKALIEEARQSAEAVREKRVQEAALEAEGVVRKAHESIEQDRRKMEAEVKAAMVGLVAATTSKVTGKILTADDQKRLNDETIKELAA
ncbi:MAG: F0F1 ATP synthase subunit B [Chthoniobacterales bacterium]|nr:F0F1 ATP synthase subunit B [Chthoniobacterales bacterium]